jgi:DNA-binding CsgD family transcriptional regulator
MSECIITQYATNTNGYGEQWHEGAKRYAHRVAYVKHHGLSHKDIVGLVVRHSCDNPSCVNPGHLSLGTHQDNMDDKVARGRQSRLTWQDHPMAKLSFDVAQHMRAEVGMTQRQLAAKYGVSQRTVNKILRGLTYAKP